MFFARLVVVALSFGSFAQVFAAPIKVDAFGVSGETTVGGPGLARRDVPTFVGSMANIQEIAQGVLSDLDNADVESVLVSALTKVDSELGTATNFLTGAGADASSLLKGVDGVTALTLEDALNELVAEAESLKASPVATTQLGSIQTHLAELQSGLSFVAPGLLALIKGPLVTVLGTLNGLLKSLGITL